MNIKADHHKTISAFLRLKDEWLFTEDNMIIVIREVQFTHTIPEPEPVEEALPINTKRYIRKKKKAEERAKALEEFRITKLVIEGYHNDGKFIGTFNDEYCERMVRRQGDKYDNFDLYKLRKSWESVVEQKDAILERETRLEAERKEKKETEKSDKEICNCDKGDMPVYEEDNKNWCPQCGLEVK